jgi:hypothetical protein
MSNEQLIVISTIIGIILTYLNARTTASSGAIGALSLTIATLRTELEAEQKQRADDKKDFEQALSQEVKLREDMGKLFERERRLLRRYIERLIAEMNAAKVPVPEMDTEE